MASACASKTGLSKQQVCALVARDRSGQARVAVTGKGPVTKAQLTDRLKLVPDTDAVLVSDNSATYAALCGPEHTTQVAVNLRKDQRVINDACPIQTVNVYHSRFKLWLDSFQDVALNTY